MKKKKVKFGICPICENKRKLTFHHEPISKKNGGKEGVYICRNCHNNMHKGVF